MQEERLTKKQRRDARKQRKADDRADRERLRKKKSLIRWIVFFGAVIIVGYGVVQLGSSPGGAGSGDLESIRDNDWTKGSSSAPVTIVEYSDFQCPACGSYFPIIKQLVENNPQKVQFVYRHYPLRQIHPNANDAAFAAEAAGKQGKFWEMHDQLFINQSEWSNTRPDSLFVKYAESIGLDIEQFEVDLKDRALSSKINSDVALGTRAGVNSTPSFYVNGNKIQNPQSLEAFQSIIDASAITSEAAVEIDEEGNIEDSAEIHAHADFKVFLEGQEVDFSDQKYQSSEENHLHDFGHLHDGEGALLHRHSNDVTLGDFFASLGGTLTNNCFNLDDVNSCSNEQKTLKMFVNGEAQEEKESYVFSDLDQILISYGAEQGEALQAQINLVDDRACIYSETCPERGSPPEESCVGGLGHGCDS